MELVIVVVIVGIIAAFAIPSYNKSMQKAREQAVVAQLVVVHGASEIYKARHGGYWNTGGADQDLAAMNNTLGINIAPVAGVEYGYVSEDANGYKAFAILDSGAYEIHMYPGPIQNQGGITNPCCWSLNCLSELWWPDGAY